MAGDRSDHRRAAEDLPQGGEFREERHKYASLKVGSGERTGDRGEGERLFLILLFGGIAVVDLLAQIGEDVPKVLHGLSPPYGSQSGSRVRAETDKAEFRRAAGAAVGIGKAQGAALAAGGHHGNALRLQQPYHAEGQGHFALAKHAGRVQVQDARRPYIGQGSGFGSGKGGRHIGKRHVRNRPVLLRRTALVGRPGIGGVVGKVQEHGGISFAVGLRSIYSIGNGAGKVKGKPKIF